MDKTRIRDRMVEHQLTRRGIGDRSVIEAMRTVPREKFVAPGFEEFAYEDAPLSIGEGQTISQPFIVALMLEKAGLKAGDKVLEVGTGSGYASALMSRIARQIYSIERHERLALQARERFETLGYHNIDVRVGDGSKGWAEAAPFDAIVVSAAAPEVPPALKEQLDLGGRLIIPVGRSQEQRLKRVTRTGPAAFEEDDLGGVVFVPLIGEDAWTEAHPMYTATVPSPGTFATGPGSPPNAQEEGMGTIDKLPALPEGVLDHTDFQQRFWAVQRLSWIMFTLLLATCLLGLLGRGGPFSRQTLLLSDGSVDFPIISRWNAPEDMTVNFTASSEDRVFTVDAAFLQTFSVQGIDPPEKATFAREGRIGYVFPADPAGPTQIVFRLQTQLAGARRATIGLGGEVRSQSTFIFP